VQAGVGWRQLSPLKPEGVCVTVHVLSAYRGCAPAVLSGGHLRQGNTTPVLGGVVAYLLKQAPIKPNPSVTSWDWC
jgi:hypothetical protein